MNAAEKYFRVYADFMKKTGEKPLTKKTFWELVRKGNKTAMVLRNPDVRKRFRTFFRDHIEKEPYLQWDRPFPYSMQVLRTARRRGARIFLVTVRRNRAALLRQVRQDFMPYFEKVLVAPPHRDSGKNYLVKERLIKPFAVPGDIIVGDSHADVRCGKNLKLVTVAVLSGMRNKNALATYAPDFIVRDIRSLKRLNVLP